MQRQISAAIQGQSKLAAGSAGSHTYAEFVDVLIFVTETGYKEQSGPQGKYRTSLERMSALLVHLEMSAGRKKAGLKLDPW